MADNEIERFLSKEFTTKKSYKIKVVSYINEDNLEIEYERGYKKIITLQKLKDMIYIGDYSDCITFYKFKSSFIKGMKIKKYIISITFVIYAVVLQTNGHILLDILWQLNIEIKLACIFLVYFLLYIACDSTRDYNSDVIYIEEYTLHFSKSYGLDGSLKKKNGTVKNISEIIITRKWIKVYGDVELENSWSIFYHKKIKIPNHIENYEDFIDSLKIIKIN